MKRLVLLFLLMASPAMAQRILIITGGTVTGNVTDSADFLVTLNQNVTGVTLTSTVTPATGYLVSMKFVQDATGSRTVVFGGNISTSCAVNSTANSVTICRWQYTASSNTWADAAGGAAANTANGAISPLNYGAKFDVRYESDCTFANTSTTVVCPSGKFTAADIGKIEFGTTALQTHGAGSLIAAPVIVAQGTITGVTNATTATVSIAATANCTGSATTLCWFAWGTQDDTAALAAAQTAAWNNGPCLTLQLPSGAAFVSAPGLGALGVGQGNACTGATDFDQKGPELAGMGQGATVIIPLPSFDFTNCTNGAANSCFGGAGALRAHDFEINGLGQTLNGTTHANSLFEINGVTTFWNAGICTGGSAANLRLAGWGLLSTSLVGFTVDGACDADVVNVTVQDFGSELCQMNASSNIQANISATGLVCFGGGTSSLHIITGAGMFSSTGGYYGYCLSGACADWLITSNSNGGIANSSGDLIFGGGTAAQNLIKVDSQAATATVNLWGDSLLLPGTTGAASQLILAIGASSSRISIGGTKATATGANNRLFNTAAGNAIIDIGGNTFTNGTLANILAGGFFGTYSATGVIQTAGNWSTPAGAGVGQWGTSPSVACPGALETAAGSSNFEACTITVGSGTVGANPVLTVTWPVAFMVAPNCQAQMTGGTAALATFTTGTITTTSGVFTYQGTPVASTTIGLQITCGSL